MKLLALVELINFLKLMKTVSQKGEHLVSCDHEKLNLFYSMFAGIFIPEVFLKGDNQWKRLKINDTEALNYTY